MVGGHRNRRTMSSGNESEHLAAGTSSVWTTTCSDLEQVSGRPTRHAVVGAGCPRL